jgi:nitrate reductase delta subunit
LPLLRRAAGSLPPRAGAPLTRFLDYAEATPPDERARHYVETFDLRRRCCPYLTYYAFGDTRKRGMALLRFTHAYRSAGFTLGSEELPDHLAVVCEFAARVPDSGLSLLQDNRAGVELLHLALTEAGSPWAYVVDAVRGVLPEAAPRDLQRALELARTGPPAEEVGLEPFAPPEYFGARR